MAKFTPGPWIVVHQWNVHSQSADASKRRAVASTAVHSRNDDAGATDEENAANARLIAAAPEMYELLRKAYHELNTIAARDGVPYTWQGWRSGVSEEHFLSVVEDARALLARIGGESDE